MDDINEDKIKYNDHDLLIILHTKLSMALKALEKIGSDVASQIQELKLTKHDKEAAVALQIAAEAVHRDHEKRLRRLERVSYIAIGALLLFQLYLSGKEAGIAEQVDKVVATQQSTFTH